MTASPYLEPGLLLLLLLPLACWPTPGMVGASESVLFWFCFFCTVIVKPRDLEAFYWLQMAKCGTNRSEAQF